MRTDPNPPRDHRAPWIPLALVGVLIAAGFLGGSLQHEPVRTTMAPARTGASEPTAAEPTLDPPAAVPETESAGSPASSTRPSAPRVDSGASPSTQGLQGLLPATSRRAFRSPLEQSPGYFPPDDPESMSVITGRREARPVAGEFAGGAPALEALLQAVFVAIERNDEHTLHALRVTLPEFERFLWPEFPQSRPITNIQPEDAWTFVQTGSLSGAGRALGSFGGRRFTVKSIASSGPLPYTNFTLWRDIVITARDESSGEIQTLRFLPAVAERRGRFKVFSYKD